jgi:cytokinesis protein
MVVNLQEVRKGMTGLRDGLGKLKQELTDHLAGVGEDDRYGKQMLTFYQRAKQQLEDLEDDVKNAESTFTDAINYYGEDDKTMSSSEFYGIFKTFVTSYKVKKLRNLCLQTRD